MQVIVSSRLFKEAPAWMLHRVGIVEPQKPPIAGIVQRQFISNAVWSSCVWLDNPSFDFDPVLCSNPDGRAVKIKQQR